MTRIGFIGVGTMGLPMAKNLVQKGFAVTAFDSNPEAVKAAAAAGMTAAATAAEAVATADIVVTMLPSSPHVESVYTGDGGVLAAARKGTLCVDMSTIDPAVSQRVAKARPTFREAKGLRSVRFDGGTHLGLSASGLASRDVTVFVVAAAYPTREPFSAFLSMGAAGKNDFETGLNVDQAAGAPSRLEVVNVEGVGAVGARKASSTLSTSRGSA